MDGSYKQMSQTKEIQRTKAKTLDHERSRPLLVSNPRQHEDPKSNNNSGSKQYERKKNTQAEKFNEVLSNNPAFGIGKSQQPSGHKEVNRQDLDQKIWFPIA